MPELRDFRDRRGQGVTPPAETHEPDLNRYPSTERPGCAPGFVLDRAQAVCVPYVMLDLAAWIGSTESGCPPGWTKRRVDLVTGQILPGPAPVQKERETTICIPKTSTNFGQR